jgi:hypothetical protein
MWLPQFESICSALAFSQPLAKFLKLYAVALLERLGNVIEVPFGRGTHPEINKLARQLTQAMSRTDSALAELKATAATINAKYNM